MALMNFEFVGTEKTAGKLKDLGGSVVPEVLAKALTDTAKTLRQSARTEMHKVFDKPTRFIINTLKYTEATPQKLEATVRPTYPGGKAVDPQKVLRAEVEGGGRREKRFEKALREKGLLPLNMQTAIPKNPYPGSDDGHGNLKGSFVVTLLSYLQAFRENGYRANMSKNKKAKMADITRFSSLSTRKTLKMTRGVEFFVSNGERVDGKNRAKHLQPGIYARSGIHGSNIRPVVIFTRRGVYAPRLDFERIARQADVEALFQRKARFAIYQAWEKGR